VDTLHPREAEQDFVWISRQGGRKILAVTGEHVYRFKLFLFMQLLYGFPLLIFITIENCDKNVLKKKYYLHENVV